MNDDDVDVDEKEIHQQFSLRSLLHREDDKIQPFVLTFPREYCGSVATGCFKVNDCTVKNNNDNTPAIRTVFCKDRGRAESLVQEAGANLGEIFARYLLLDTTGGSDVDTTPCRRVVARCETIDRPRLEDMKPGSAGAQMWRLKEKQWQEIYEKKGGKGEGSKDEDENEDDSGDEDSSSSSGTSSSASKSAPSTKECWLLEEAVRYYDPTMSTSEEGEANDALSPSVDSSLRQKLRMAADRSVSGCLDMVTLFMLTEASQKYVNGPNPEWPDYKVAHQLSEEETRRNLALTADETRLLFCDKLIGRDVQIAMLYTIVVGLPDNHCGNMAIQEVVVCRDDSSMIDHSGSDAATWRLRIVHFDTGLASVHGGVSLKSLKLAYDEDKDSVDYGNDFDFEGGENGRAYYYPILFSSVFSEASDCSLDARVRERLLRMDGREFDRLIPKYDVLQEDSEFGRQIISVFQRRLEQMKRHAEKHPECTCKDLAFSTISAWKRDYAINEEHEVFVEWIQEVKHWAQHS